MSALSVVQGRSSALLGDVNCVKQAFPHPPSSAEGTLALTMLCYPHGVTKAKR